MCENCNNSEIDIENDIYFIANHRTQFHTKNNNQMSIQFFGNHGQYQLYPSIQESLHNVKNITCGDYFTVLHMHNDTLQIYQTKTGRMKLWKPESDSATTTITGVTSGGKHVLVLLTENGIQKLVTFGYRSNEYYGTSIIPADKYHTENDGLKCHFVSLVSGVDHDLVLSSANLLYLVGSTDLMYSQIGSRNMFIQYPRDIHCMQVQNRKLYEERVCAIGAGNNFSIVITIDNKQKCHLWSSGSNLSGQLCLGDYENRHHFTKSKFFDSSIRVKQLSVSGEHVVLLTEKGRVWVAGSNLSGQLGLSDRVSITVLSELPFKAFGNQKIVQISAGDSHTAFVTETNEIWFSGSNKYGQCIPYSTIDKYYLPVKLQSKEFSHSAVLKLSCGKKHTIVCYSQLPRVSLFDTVSSGVNNFFSDIQIIALDISWH
jgi:alpha-tubulin suppressor-like RCC1 family protein